MITRKIYKLLFSGPRLICIKSYNDHNFVKIHQNLPKFGNLEDIGNLKFAVTYEIRYLCHVTTYGRFQEGKEN